MIPNNLKIGDTYTEESADGKVFVSKVTGFDGEGRYISEFVGMAGTKEITKEAVKTSEPTEEVVTPIEQLLAEEKPAPKKAPARKPTTRRKKK